MGIYDLVMLIIFLGSVLFGAWKGLAWQIASLAAVIVSYFVAINFREPVSQYISAEPPWNKFGAMLILFLGTSLLIWMVFGRIKESIKKMHLGGFDRQAGALLGAVKGGLLCMVVTMFAVTLFGDATTQAVCNSRSGGYISRGINQLTTIVPDEIHGILNPYVDRFNEAIDNKNPGPQSQYVEGNVTGGFGANQPLYGGQQTTTNQQNGQPQFGTFNPYQQSNANQNYQNYQGQWQQPAGNQPIYTNQPNANQPNLNQPQYSGNPNQGAPNYQQTGYQNGSYQPVQTQPQNGQQRLITPGQNGYPNVNFQINSKDLLDAGTEAAREAARRLLENATGNPNSNR